MLPSVVCLANKCFSASCGISWGRHGCFSATFQQSRLVCISMEYRSDSPLSRATCTHFRQSGCCHRGCVRTKNGRVHIMCHRWTRGTCRHVTNEACPKGHHWYYRTEDNAGTEDTATSGKDSFLIVMKEACQRLLREHADGKTSDDDFKKKKQQLILLFHPDKAPLHELVPQFTEVAKILNTQLNVPF